MLFDCACGNQRAGTATARSAYLFQDYALFPHLTVEENIGFALKQWWQRARPRTSCGGWTELIELFELGD